MNPIVEDDKNNDEVDNVINDSKNKIANNRHSSLPKNLFKKTNNLNLDYNELTKTKSYYLESSYSNNNFIINKLNTKKYYSNNQYKKNRDYSNNISKNTNFIDNLKLDSFYILLLDFIKQDNSIENIRQSLSMREDANLTDLFNLFDHSSNQLISCMDFLETLKEMGLYLNKDEMKYIFRKFNKNMNEYFEFEEFCEIILPKKYSSAKIMSEKKNGYNYEISEETKSIISLLFKNIIEGEKSNENYRIKIWKNGEYSGSDLFNEIKKSYSIGIYKEDFANFMKKNKYKVSNAELELLMERFDKNKDGMIDYKEFLNEISPMNEL
jgi:Ca2+-binding EF-hand superfamily protein